MKYLSLFSGIEAASVAWEPLGWEPVAFAEFEDFPKAVLAHRFPDVPDLGDVTQITEDQIRALGPFDILVGGSPCQDLSVAGKRAGLKHDDGSTTRSGLFDEQMRIFEIAREHNECRYLLWENVPGSFSSNGGDDFRYILEAMVCGSVPLPPDRWRNSGVAVSGNGRRIVEWRVLDAQYFGVPQRRKRIFALLDTGAWWSRSPILFEQESLRGNITESREEGEGIAGGVEGSVGSSCFCLQGSMIGREDKNGPQGDGINIDKSFTLNTTDRHAIAVRTEGSFASSSFGGYDEGVGTLKASGGDIGGGSETLITSYAVRTAQTGANGIGVAKEKAHTLDGANGQAVCMKVLPFDTTQVTSPQNGNNPHFGDPCHPLVSSGHPPTIIYENHPNDSRVTRCDDGISPTLSSRMGTGGGNVPFVLAPLPKQDKGGVFPKVTGTLMARDYKGVGRKDTWDKIVVTHE